MVKQDEAPALQIAIAGALSHRHRASTLRRLSLAPPSSVDFSSNDFLSLSTSPLLRNRFQAELAQHPTTPLASGGSRLLDGNTTYALSLETLVASHHRAPAALLTNSGYDANVAIFSTLPQPTDVIIYDSLVHASVHDGMRASRSPRAHHISFAHNDISDFASVLEFVLESFPAISAGVASTFVAVEAIYSMDGDVAPLRDIITTVDRLLTPSQRRNVHVVVDEAHATGVLGERGRGLVCSLRLEDRISVRLHTFGKALGANGAAILCGEQIKAYLLNYARPLIYTTFLSFPALALVRSAYELMVEGSTEELVSRLKGSMRMFHQQMQSLQAELTAVDEDDVDLLKVHPAEPQSPIFSVETSDPRGLATHCQRRGYVVRPIMPPTVPAGSERVRVCLHSGNTTQQIEGLVTAMRDWCRQRQLDRQRSAGEGLEVRVYDVDRAKL